MIEAQRMLKSSPGDDVERFYDAGAMEERIREWLDTPEGTMAHYPSWGHNLTPFKHDPLSKGNDLDVLMEMAIARKLPIDVEDLILKGVNVVVLVSNCKNKDINIWCFQNGSGYGANSTRSHLFRRRGTYFKQHCE